MFPAYLWETNGVSPSFVETAVSTSDQARIGELTTRRGVVKTPAFMPVGTQAAVKTLTPEEVAATGAEIILANTYHLMLRPGAAVLERAGGLHQFMHWCGPILTDSGGYQVFSLAGMRKVQERGVTFRSHIDGSAHELTPERVIDIQLAFGSDIIMPLDELTGYRSSADEQRSAATRTHRWLDRAIAHFQHVTEHKDDHAPMLFGICQGGFLPDERSRSATYVAASDVDGCAIGGLSVGESKQELLGMLAHSVAELPEHKPRYLMGVGSPEDVWNAVGHGVDMFDCVHPTRVARRGAVFTRDGRINLTAGRFRESFEPIEPECDCLACQGFSKAYIHHLFRTSEHLGPRLATIHNLRFFGRMMDEIRTAIADDLFERRRRAFLDRYRPVDELESREQRRRWHAQHSRQNRSTSGSNDANP
jgi:queuine tRNA-ribosyltransferase